MRAVSISIIFAGAALAAPLCSAPSNQTVQLELGPATIANLQLALFLENLEAGFLQSAIANVSSADSQYGSTFNTTLQDAAMQEAVHQRALQNILVAAGAELIPPCQYEFPSYNTSQFLALGRSLSVVGVGAVLAITGDVAVFDPELVSGLASIATVEARHSAFFETANGQVPNPAAFDTPVAPLWAYNLALNFVVPGSCGLSPPLPILPILSAKIDTSANMTVVAFSWDSMQQPLQREAGKPLFIAWVNQLGPPVYTPLNATNSSSGTAEMPQGLMGGVFAALTAQDSVITIEELAGSTLAGPAVVMP